MTMIEGERSVATRRWEATGDVFLLTLFIYVGGATSMTSDYNSLGIMMGCSYSSLRFTRTWSGVGSMDSIVHTMLNQGLFSKVPRTVIRGQPTPPTSPRAIHTLTRPFTMAGKYCTVDTLFLPAFSLSRHYGNSYSTAHNPLALPSCLLLRVFRITGPMVCRALLPPAEHVHASQTDMAHGCQGVMPGRIGPINFGGSS